LLSIPVLSSGSSKYFAEDKRPSHERDWVEEKNAGQVEEEVAKRDLDSRRL